MVLFMLGSLLLIPSHGGGSSAPPWTDDTVACLTPKSLSSAYVALKTDVNLQVLFRRHCRG